MTTNFDFQAHPLVATWETNARSGPKIGDIVQFPGCDPMELTDREAEQLIRDIAELQPAVFILKGADPLRRKNIYSLLQYAASNGLHPYMVLEPGSEPSRTAIADLKSASLSRLGLTLEAGNVALHDHLCGIVGSYERTLAAIKWANECRLPIQIHTNLRRRNLHGLRQIASVINRFRILGWSVSFPVPQPRDSLHELPSAGEFEEAFITIHELAQELPFKVKTVDAPHYRRFVVQQRTKARVGTGGLSLLPSLDGGIPGILPINQERASIFVSSTGEIFPSRGLRVAAGNTRTHKLAEVYRNSALFQSLRDPGKLKGKCSCCEFRDLCGGSRARAWGVHGDVFAEEPCCSYLQAAVRKIG